MRGVKKNTNKMTKSFSLNRNEGERERPETPPSFSPAQAAKRDDASPCSSLVATSTTTTSAAAAGDEQRQRRTRPYKQGRVKKRARKGQCLSSPPSQFARAEKQSENERMCRVFSYVIRVFA